MANEKKLDFRQRSHAGIDRMMDGVESMRDSGQEKLDLMKERAAMMRETVDGYIRKNPEKAVLIAAGVGVIIGALFTAAMMRRKE